MDVAPVVWTWNAGDRFCVLEGLDYVDDVFEITKGISRARNFAKDARFEMSARHPKRVALADNLSNLDRMLVVSKRLKEFISSREPPDVEYLPVTIYNHKKKVASADSFIVHPTAVVDCIDQGASTLRWNKIDPEKLSAAQNLVLIEGSIDWKHPLFRPKHLEYYVMVHPDLAEAIVAAGFTGVRFKTLDDFEA